jgi:hypothetical protein
MLLPRVRRWGANRPPSATLRLRLSQRALARGWALPTWNAIDTAFACALGALACAGRTASAAVTLRTSRLIGIERERHRRGKPEGYPQNQDVHRKISIMKGIETAEPRHTAWSRSRHVVPTRKRQNKCTAAASIPPDAVQNPHRPSDRRPDGMAGCDLNRSQFVIHRGLNHAHSVVNGTIKIENVTVCCRDR